MQMWSSLAATKGSYKSWYDLASYVTSVSWSLAFAEKQLADSLLDWKIFDTYRNGRVLTKTFPDILIDIAS